MKSYIIFSEITDCFNTQTLNYLNFVSEEKRKRLEKYRFSVDCKLSLYADLLVRTQIISKLGLKNQDIEFETNKYGKPRLKGFSNFHFNVSHTRTAVAAAFSDKEIGVDIEKIVEPNFEIAKRFFTQNENNYIVAQNDSIRAFYEVWTKKESYVKYTGFGLNQPLSSFDVMNEDICVIAKTYCVDNYLISVCGSHFSKEEPRLFKTSESEINLIINNVV